MQIYWWWSANTLFDAQKRDQIQRIEYEGYCKSVQNIKEKGRKAVNDGQIRQRVTDHSIQWTPSLIVHSNWKMLLLPDSLSKGVNPRCKEGAQNVQSRQKSSNTDGRNWCRSIQWHQNIRFFNQRVEKHLSWKQGYYLHSRTKIWTYIKYVE